MPGRSTARNAHEDGRVENRRGRGAGTRDVGRLPQASALTIGRLPRRRLPRRSDLCGCHTLGTKAFHTRDDCLGTLAAMAKAATTEGGDTQGGDTLGPGGARGRGHARAACGREALFLARTAAGSARRRGARALRLCDDGSVRRGPVTLRARDLERLRAGLGGAPPVWRRRCGLKPPSRRERALAGGVDERARTSAPSAGAEQRVDRVLRVRHQPEDVAVARCTTPAMSATEPFGFSPARSAARSGRFASSSPSSSSSANQQPSPCLTGIVSALPGAQREVNGVSARSTTQRDVAADERQRRVRAEHAREQARLAEDLEAVADAEHEAALGAKRVDGAHHRREPRDRAAAQVVAVREPAGQDDARRRRAAPARACQTGTASAPSAASAQRGVAVVVRAGEDDDARSAAGVGRSCAVELDLVALDQRVREQLLAHPLDLARAPRPRSSPRARGRSACRRARRRPRSRGAGASSRRPRPAGRGSPASAGRGRLPSPEHHVRVGEVVVEGDPGQALERLDVARAGAGDDVVRELRAGSVLSQPSVSQ